MKHGKKYVDGAKLVSFLPLEPDPDEEDNHEGLA